MPRPKNDEREQLRAIRRNQILNAAADEFAREGYLGANTNRIAKSAGFAAGTLFNYFPTKQALILALLDQTAQEHFDFILNAVLSKESPDQRLNKFFEAGFEFISQNIAPARVMVNTIYGADEKLKQHLYQAYLPMFQLLAQKILSPGIEQGIFRSFDPMDMANMVMIFYLGTASQVTDEGKFFLGVKQVTDFVSRALFP